VIDYINDTKGASKLAHSKGFASKIVKISLYMSFATETN